MEQATQRRRATRSLHRLRDLVVLLERPPSNPRSIPTAICSILSAIRSRRPDRVVRSSQAGGEDARRAARRQEAPFPFSSTSGLIADATPLRPPSDSAVDAVGQAAARDQLLTTASLRRAKHRSPSNGCCACPAVTHASSKRRTRARHTKRPLSMSATDC